MTLTDAQSIVRQVQGKSYSYLLAWGRGTIGEALRTIEDRKSATDADREIAESIQRKLVRKW